MKSFKILSPAKINLCLFLGKKRDDHYHDLISLMVPLHTPSDILTFKPHHRLSVRIKTSISNQKKRLPSEKKNIVWKAATLFHEEIRQKPKIAITIDKHVPMGAGLGGGSSNAASTLLALNSSFHYPLTQKKLLSLAQKLGSDVPFFIHQKPALVSGRGEKIQIVPFSLNDSVLVVYPGFPISTAWAYSQWDKNHCSLTKNVWNVKNYSFFLKKRHWENDFEKVIFPQYPILKKIKEALIESGALYASLSGSGSCVFGIFRTKKRKEQSWISLK